MRTLTQDQVEAALTRIWLPGQPSGSTPATPAELAVAIFKVAADLQPEADRWETGALYADPGLPGMTYRRKDWGWHDLHSGGDFRDGELVTDEFRKIGFPGGGPVIIDASSRR
jgi:hypothetical protein